ncbi:MAG TPA: hypothetical protein VG271_13475 [Beijerinckiaceae bacterium]|jgi:hypothetical protein|nr:hypothetical protein [Beijerinckiaceae bacterium]
MTGLTRNQRKRRQLVRLFERQNGLCFWCKKPMHLWVHVQGETPPIDSCTIDHLDSRLSPMRGKHPHGEIRHVASCWKCNNERANEEHRAYQLQGRVA